MALTSFNLFAFPVTNASTLEFFYFYNCQWSHILRGFEVGIMNSFFFFLGETCYRYQVAESGHRSEEKRPISP